jgi:SAM-dependent methyltransferase
VSFEWQAGSWLRWARTPDHDAYWQFRDAFFDEIVPAPGRLTLEVGCGEGRVARDLARRGHRVVALDASPTLAASAAAADPAGRYLVADAATLPFGSGCFDLVVAYNSLMDVDDMPAAVAEAARVLQPGRPLCVCVTHPTADAGRFQSTDLDAPFVIAGSYLGRHRVDEPFERDGLQMHFTGWRYPLEAYARALEDAGLLIDRLREPPAPASALTTRPGYERWQRLPFFLHLRAVKPVSG